MKDFIKKPNNAGDEWDKLLLGEEASLDKSSTVESEKFKDFSESFINIMRVYE